MKIKLFVDWKNQYVYSEKEYNEQVQKYAKSIAENEEKFFDYLNRSYIPSEIWNLTNARKSEIFSNWKIECCEYAKDYYSDYDKVEIDV